MSLQNACNFFTWKSDCLLYSFKPWGISGKGLYNNPQDLLFACLFVLTLDRSIKTQAFPADGTLIHNFSNTDEKFQSTLTKYYQYNTNPFIQFQGDEKWYQQSLILHMKAFIMQK